MQRVKFLSIVAMGAGLGFAISQAFLGSPRPVAAANDRSEGYIICTGPCAVNPRSPLDGVWLLDHKQGKLLGTIVDRTIGKTVGFADVDLISEFGIGSNQSPNFVMTTGTIAAGQAALYLAETNTGQFGVYTLGPGPVGSSAVTILRHDLTNFRKTNK